MRFERYRESLTLYEPSGKPIETWAEVRVHPITGELTRVIQVPLRKFSLPDLQKMAEETEATCPFCPPRLEQVTPRFDRTLLEKGWLRRGQAVLIPNRFPYDRYCALIILSDQHYVPLDSWDDGTVTDGLLLAQAFLNRVMVHDPAVRAFSLNWNFAPHSGSSILHPHIQLSAGSFATNRARRMLAASYQGWLQGEDLIARWLHAERETGERWCAQIGPWHLIMAFAPRGRFFELNLIHESAGPFVSLSPEDVADLARGITKVFRFISSMGLSSMNLALFSPLRGEGSFHSLVSISPRACVGPYQMSDISFQMLIDEFFVLFLPEELAKRFRDGWEKD